MEILLDTNFIMSCVKQNIDFISFLNQNFEKIIVPEKVIGEIKKIKDNKKVKLRDRESASLALQMLDNSEIKIINLKEKKVDDGIVSYVENNNIVVATIDKELKKRLKGKVKILGIKAMKKIDYV